MKSAIKLKKNINESNIDNEIVNDKEDKVKIKDEEKDNNKNENKNDEDDDEEEEDDEDDDEEEDEDEDEEEEEEDEDEDEKNEDKDENEDEKENDKKDDLIKKKKIREMERKFIQAHETKKIKESFDDNIIQLNEFLVLIKNLDDEIDFLDKEYKLKIKKRNSIFKQFISKFKILPKIYSDDIIIAKKTKPKRKSSNNGFIKPNPVPEVLRKFLNLNDDVLLPRPTISRLLNAKFNELGLKKGQNTQLNEDVCNLLKLNYDDYKEIDIKLTNFQTFLAKFYKSVEHQVDLGN